MSDDAQIRQIQVSYSALGARSVALVSAFYGHLFVLAPALRELCPGDEHDQRWLLATLDELIGVLDERPLAVRYARYLARGLARRGVNGRHYTTIGVALLAALGACYGPEFTLELQVAWARGYARIAEVMHEAAAGHAAHGKAQGE